MNTGHIPDQRAIDISDDERRLAVLESYGVLDTPPEPAFDDLVLAAAGLCRAPLAMISFVDKHRQWFKATTGTALRETPIDHAICVFVVEGRGPLVIGDLAADPRTAANPLVTAAPFVRFYAAYPLIATNGDILGTLAVLDTVARPSGLSDGEHMGLAALARQVMRLLDLHRDVVLSTDILARQRVASAQILDRAQHVEAAYREVLQDHASQLTAGAAGGIGTFELDLLTDHLRMSPEMCRILGLAPKADWQLGDWISVIHPDDLMLLPDMVARRDGSAGLTLRYRILRADSDEERWVLRRAKFDRDATGRAVRMIGTLQDITQERRATSRLTALLELGDLLRDAGTREEALQRACRAMGEVLRVQRVGFQHADARHEIYTPEHVWCGPDGKPLVGPFAFGEFPRSTSFLQDGALCAFNDLTTMAWIAEERTAHQAIDVAAQVLVPLMAGDALVGCLFVHCRRPRDWTLEETTFIQAAADRIFVALEMLDAESRQQTVNEEILHRLKNTLTLAQALAHQALRGVEDREAVQAFSARLVALSSAHDMLGRDGWHSTDLLSLAQEVCGRLDHGGHVRIEGPFVTLGAQNATSLAMVLHELMTNAIKHGALSVPEGQVSLHWRIEGTGAARSVVLSWAEAGGALVSAPSRRGFGLKVLENGLGRLGRMSLDFAAEGLRGELRVSLAALAAG